MRLITHTPYPVFPNELARVPMIWNGVAEHGKLSFTPTEGCGVTGAWPTVNDFNSGRATIGTGPYVMKSYVKGNGIDLTRNDAYWGEKPEWQDVRMVAVSSAGPRLTGLLSGDFDLIENPAARDLKRIKDSGLGYVTKPSVRVMFFQLDTAHNLSPMVKSPKGDNPLQDVRVRQAISMAINRKTIIDRIMSGSNYGGYNNPEMDSLFMKAIGTVDDAERARLLNQVLTIALAEMPNVPLHFESGVWAFRKGLTYEGRADQRTMATSTRSAK